jgi:hypothetical protein
MDADHTNTPVRSSSSRGASSGLGEATVRHLADRGAAHRIERQVGARLSLSSAEHELHMKQALTDSVQRFSLMSRRRKHRRSIIVQCLKLTFARDAR